MAGVRKHQVNDGLTYTQRVAKAIKKGTIEKEDVNKSILRRIKKNKKQD